MPSGLNLLDAAIIVADNRGSCRRHVSGQSTIAIMRGVCVGHEAEHPSCASSVHQISNKKSCLSQARATPSL